MSRTNPDDNLIQDPEQALSFTANILNTKLAWRYFGSTSGVVLWESERP